MENIEGNDENVTIKLAREEEGNYNDFDARFARRQEEEFANYRAGNRITIEKALHPKFFDGTFAGNAGEAVTTFDSIVEYLLRLKDDAGNPPSVDERNQIIDNVTNSYIMQTRKTPKGSKLQRLANWLMLETLTDSHSDKITREEYPIMTKRQLRTRYRREMANENLTETHTKLRYLKGRKSVVHINAENN